VGGGRVEVHARVALQPPLRRFILVNVQVIQDNVQVEVGSGVSACRRPHLGPAS
jgi:hypothetical protein